MVDSAFYVGGNFSKIDDSGVSADSNNTIWWWPTLCGNESEDDAFWVGFVAVTLLSRMWIKCFVVIILFVHVFSKLQSLSLPIIFICEQLFIPVSLVYKCVMGDCSYLLLNGLWFCSFVELSTVFML